jgi:hypothetical protein
VRWTGGGGRDLISEAEGQAGCGLGAWDRVSQRVCLQHRQRSVGLCLTGLEFYPAPCRALASFFLIFSLALYPGHANKRLWLDATQADVVGRRRLEGWKARPRLPHEQNLCSRTRGLNTTWPRCTHCM